MGRQDDSAGFDSNLVYVKSVEVADLPDIVQEQAGGAERIFAIHNADGEQIALVANRDLAYLIARQHDMRPLTLH